MTTFTNAPAPRSALFDDAPAAPANVREPPEHLTPATRIAQGRNGRWYALEVLMQYGRPVPLALALSRVGIGRTVFVAREDAGKVLETLSRADSAG